MEIRSLDQTSKLVAEPNPAPSKVRYNFSNAQVLFVEPSPHGMEILTQIMSGYGVSSPHKAATMEEAISILHKHEMDLVVCEANLAESDGYDLVQWLRRANIGTNAHTSAILISGHTQVSKVHKARDCGANFIVAKPLQPKALIDRLIWIARTDRAFIQCDTYAGPDRRFQSVGPPPNTEGRRRDDLSLEIGEAKEGNISQEDIDALMKPVRLK